MNNFKHVATFFFASMLFFSSLAAASEEYSFSQEKFLNGIALLDLGGEPLRIPPKAFIELYEGVTLTDGTNPRFIRWEHSPMPEEAVYKVEAVFDHGSDVDENVRFIFGASPKDVISDGNYRSQIFFVELGSQVKMNASEYFLMLEDALPEPK